MAGCAEVDEFNRNFNEVFCLIACLESITGAVYGTSTVEHLVTWLDIRDSPETCRRVEHGSMLSWVMMRDIRRKELALFHLRGSLANPSVLLMCCMLQD